MAKENNYNVLSKPVAKRGRNTFNLNNQHVYSMKSGQIIPVKATHFMPGDYFKMKANDFTITFPMKSAPFLRMRKEFSFYSVYHNAVWSLFNQYMAGRQDPKSSAFGVNPVLQEPRIKLISLFASALNQFGAYLFLEHIMPALLSIKNSTEEWGYTDVELDTIANNFRLNFFNRTEFGIPFAYGSNVTIVLGRDFECIWEPLNVEGIYNPLAYDCFACTPYDASVIDTMHNDRVYQDIVGNYRCYDWLRKLDMLGYGNYYPIFNQCEREVINAIEEYISIDGSTMMAAVNTAFLTIAHQLVRSFCTWTADTTTPSEAQIVAYKMVNLYPICEYNSIFYHFFRNSFYDNNYLSHDYSLDFISAGTGGSSYNEVHLSDFSTRFLDIEYHQWKKDMFTSVLPDEQFGAVSSISLNVVGVNTGSDLGRWHDSNSTSLSSAAVVTDTTNKFLNAENISGIEHTHTVPSQSVAFDMISLKRAEMLQEYRQTLMRAGNKTSDVFRALYGESPSSEHLDDIIPRFLETFGEDLVVDPVVSTADTGQGINGSLGDISARAKGSGSSKEFKFDAGSNFGCVFTLAYVVPTSMYNSYMIDKHLFELTPEQHFIPNFENCGLEDVYSDELNMLLPANNIASLGKQARYYHKKTDVDKVHGAFCAASSFRLVNTPIPANDAKNVMWFGDFNHWISSRTDMQLRNITTLRDFYINPSVLDNVFVRASGADQADDQFICTTLIECDATKQISKVGLVNFV